MALDNFQQINGLLNFPNSKEDDNFGDVFYHLQILRRGKDHKDMAAANRLIKSYYIDKPGSLDFYKNEIIKLCNIFDARAYINLNPKSYKQCTLRCISDMAKRASDGDFQKIYKQWNSVVGYTKPVNRKDARWIIDVDSPFVGPLYDTIKSELIKIWARMRLLELKKDIPDFENLSDEQLLKMYESCVEYVETNILFSYIYSIITTKNGYHIITAPFDLGKFNEVFNNTIDVHKNNPTILYIPDSIMNKTSKNN